VDDQHVRGEFLGHGVGDHLAADADGAAGQARDAVPALEHADDGGVFGHQRPGLGRIAPGNHWRCMSRVSSMHSVVSGLYS